MATFIRIHDDDNGQTYDGARALAALQQLGVVRLNEIGVPLANAALIETAAYRAGETPPPHTLSLQEEA